MPSDILVGAENSHRNTGIPCTIICVDSSSDNTTRLVAQYRETNVYQKLRTMSHSVLSHRGSQAVKRYVQETFKKHVFTYFTASGHGNKESFIGGDLLPLWEVGQSGFPEVNQSIIHLLACQTATQLGPDLIGKGCVAFFGYDVDFLFDSKHIDIFLAGDAEIDIAFGEGCTAEEVYERSIKKYDEMIDHLNQQNLLWLSATLAENKDHLCAPSVNGCWGDKHATITEKY